MPKFLYKYTPHNTCYKYDIITKNELWFAKIESLNDPMDTNLRFKQNYSENEIQEFLKYMCNKNGNSQNFDEIVKKWGKNEDFVWWQNSQIQAFKDRMGVLCMSVNPLNIAMWSHYANNHKGVVYEFHPNLFNFNETKDTCNAPGKVFYQADYELLSYTATDKNMENELASMLSIKGEIWAYEEEFRFINLKFNGAKKFDKNCLKSIIFGVKTSIDEIKCVKECCEKHRLNHINFKQAQFIPGKFELEMVDI